MSSISSYWTRKYVVFITKYLQSKIDVAEPSQKIVLKWKQFKNHNEVSK